MDNQQNAENVLPTMRSPRPSVYFDTASEVSWLVAPEDEIQQVVVVPVPEAEGQDAQPNEVIRRSLGRQDRDGNGTDEDMPLDLSPQRPINFGLPPSPGASPGLATTPGCSKIPVRVKSPNTRTPTTTTHIPKMASDVERAGTSKKTLALPKAKNTTNRHHHCCK